MCCDSTCFLMWLQAHIFTKCFCSEVCSKLRFLLYDELPMIFCAVALRATSFMIRVVHSDGRGLDHILKLTGIVKCILEAGILKKVAFSVETMGL